jgi:hypothetical protein
MPWYTSQRRGTVRTLPNYSIVLFYVFFLSIVLLYVFFVCKCVVYYCHRVSTQLQLNISYHKRFKFYTGAILIAEFLKVIHVCLRLLISFHWFLTSIWDFYISAVFCNMYLLLWASCHCVCLKL